MGNHELLFFVPEKAESSHIVFKPERLPFL